jgi:hypothetical protein
MGWFWGEDKTNAPQASTNSTISNTVSIGHAVNIESDDMEILLLAICIIKIIELGLFLYREHRRGLKKKYNATNAGNL